VLSGEKLADNFDFANSSRIRTDLDKAESAVLKSLTSSDAHRQFIVHNAQAHRVGPLGPSALVYT
jgi:hypothetical protein